MSSSGGFGGSSDLRSQQLNEAVLITGPQCVVSTNRLDSSVVRIEPVQFQNVDVSEQSNPSNPIVRLIGSSGFSLISQTNSSTMANSQGDATELGEIIRDTNNKLTFVGEYDACREYNCQVSDDNNGSSDDDNDDDDEDDEYEHNNLHEIRHPENSVISLPLSESINAGTKSMPGFYLNSLRQQQQPQQPKGRDRIYILGRQYDAILDYDARRDDESSLFWFTYRCDFPSMDPYGITSDAGWGCMLRASQMLLAQTLRLHYKGRDWYPPTAKMNQSLAYRRSDPFVRSLLTWFADFPSSNSFNSGDCLYSLHNMVAVGLIKHDKLPGEWYGPGTACYVLRDLVQRHQRQQELSLLQQQKVRPDGNSGSFGTASRKMFRVHVASSEGAVYRDEIHQLMTKDIQAMEKQNVEVKTSDNKNTKQTKAIPAHPLDFTAWEDELVESTEKNGREIVQWDTALLLLIPLRLGLRNFQTEYVDVVAHTFSLPQSVGVLGGRPRGARWFFGAQVNGNTSHQIFGLDPHTVQTAPRRRTASVNGISKQIVELSDEYLRSVHTSFTETFSLDKMDPSIALGFYCRDHADLENLFYSLRLWKESHPNSPELFNVQDSTPNYDSSNVDDMMNDDSTELIDAPSARGMQPVTINAHDDDDEEDEYVML